jgi:hypothetical protein
MFSFILRFAEGNQNDLERLLFSFIPCFLVRAIFCFWLQTLPADILSWRWLHLP